MANPKIQINSNLIASLRAYDLAAAYEGITNVYELVSKYAGVTFVAERNAGLVNCNKNRVEKSIDTIAFNMNANVWGAIVSDLFTNFASSVHAQRILALFVDAAFLDFAQFDLATEYTNTADGGAIPFVNIVPNVSKIFYQAGSVGLEKGFYGDGVEGLSLQRTSTTSLKAGLHSSWNSVQFNFVAYDERFNVIQSSFNGTVSDGQLAIDHTPGDGAYTVGSMSLDKVIFDTAANQDALKIDLNVAKMQGVNANFILGYTA